jgi:hypothetical protein
VGHSLKVAHLHNALGLTALSLASGKPAVRKDHPLTQLFPHKTEFHAFAYKEPRKIGENCPARQSHFLVWQMFQKG